MLRKITNILGLRRFHRKKLAPILIFVGLTLFIYWTLSVRHENFRRTLFWFQFHPFIHNISEDPSTKMALSSNWRENEHLSISLKNFTITEDDPPLVKLSKEFQNELNHLQNPPFCSNVTTVLLCGHSDSNTGLGAQIQHRMGCLMLSYALKFPLIHDEFSYWKFTEPWRRFLKPFGTSCPLSSFTHIQYWDWVTHKLFKFNSTKFQLDGRNMERARKDRLPRFEFPLKNGVHVPRKVAEKVKKHVRNPFLWFIGQFNQAVYEPLDYVLNDVEILKKSLGISKAQLQGAPLIGIHARRTDKIGEVGTFVTTEEFMAAINLYLGDIKWNYTTPLTIFVATEDCDVIRELNSEFAARAANLNFVSFCAETRKSFESRKGQLFGIIRDISILADCDYVICTFSSNVGRTVLELRSRKWPMEFDPEKNIKSLDTRFYFDLYWTAIKTQKLILV